MKIETTICINMDEKEDTIADNFCQMICDIYHNCDSINGEMGELRSDSYDLWCLATDFFQKWDKRSYKHGN